MGRRRTMAGSPVSWVRSAMLSALVLFAVAAFSGEAAAQCPGGPLIALPPPCLVSPNGRPPINSVQQSSQAAVLDLGSNFLQRFNAVVTHRTAASAGNDPQGGGAEPGAARYRTWFEGYGLRSVTDAQGAFPGDNRKTGGGVAGFGATVAPGATVGLSVDQSQTLIGVNGGTQSGRLDFTQIGAIGSYERGPWNISVNAVYGLGEFRTTRFDGFGNSIAAYRTHMWAAMSELSYYGALPNNSRVVPKFNIEWMHSRTDAFTETGGVAPIAASAVNASRFRLMAGAELGHSWLIDRRVMDVSVYGRLVNNVSQRIDDAQLDFADTPTGAPVFVAGVRESRLGADAGFALSGKVTDLMRLYVLYDARFRSNIAVHGGTVGAEFRF